MHRRKFIKHAITLLGGMVAAPPLSWSSLLGSDEMRRIAVVGLGHRGMEFLRILAANSVPHVRLAACDVDLRQFRDRVGQDLAYFSNVDVLLREFVPHVVYIATPDHHHAAMASKACRSGCLVIMDPPLALNIAELEAVTATPNAYQSIYIVDEIGTRLFKSWESIRALDRLLPSEVVIEHRNWWTDLPSVARLEPPPPELHWSDWRGSGAKLLPFDDRVLSDWRTRSSYSVGPMAGDALGAVSFALGLLRTNVKEPIAMATHAAFTSRNPHQRCGPRGNSYLPDQEECRLLFPDGRRLLWRRESLYSRYPRRSETTLSIDGTCLNPTRLPVDPQIGLSLRRLSPDFVNSTRIALTAHLNLTHSI